MDFRKAGDTGRAEPREAPPRYREIGEANFRAAEPASEVARNLEAIAIARDIHKQGRHQEDADEEPRETTR